MISAIIPAAGESKRMGQPKMSLPWGNTTVLGRVIEVLQASEVNDILVICGGAQIQVEAICKEKGVKSLLNEFFTDGEMLSSVQVGLKAIKPQAEAVLITLGDQPQIQGSTIRLIIGEYLSTNSPLVVPSYWMHRGHPWLVAKKYWDEIALMHAPESLREFLNRRSADISYVNVDTSTILQDLDTPEDYLKSKP